MSQWGNESVAGGGECNVEKRSGKCTKVLLFNPSMSFPLSLSLRMCVCV